MSVQSKDGAGGLRDRVTDSVQFAELILCNGSREVAGESLKRSSAIGVSPNFERIFTLELQKPCDGFQEFDRLFLRFHPIFVAFRRFLHPEQSRGGRTSLGLLRVHKRPG